MGNLWVVVKTILEDLGVEVVVPPFPSRRSLDVGVRHSPEFACYPLKLNIGDFVAAIEMGADTILMAGGVGPCRFGHYAQVEAQILRDLGYSVEMIVLEPPRGHFRELLAKLGHLTGGKSLGRVYRSLRFGWEKLLALDELDKTLAPARAAEALANRARGSAAATGRVAAAHRLAVAAVERADGVASVRRAAAEGVRAIQDAVPGDPEGRGGPGGRCGPGGRGGPACSCPLPGDPRPLRVGLVGEIFMIEEPFANQWLERRLGALGVEVVRAVYVSDWVRTHLLLDALRLKSRSRLADLGRAAGPYLGHFVGGEGLASVGEAVLLSARGFDGMVHVAPFTCMPEIVAASLLPEVAQDLGLPILSLFMDEHTGEAGLETRLEAFVDLLGRRRFRRVEAK